MAFPHRFNSIDTVRDLNARDPQLLRSIVEHNETFKELCDE